MLQLAWLAIQAFILAQLLFLHQTVLVRCCDTGHGHVGAVDEEDEDGEQTDHRTHHAEADDATTAQVQSLHDVAAQKGAAAAGWYHHVSWGGGGAEIGMQSGCTVRL